MRDEKRLTKIVAASLLGDASISKDKRDNGNACFEITLIEEHRDHLEYLAGQLEHLTKVSILRPSAAMSLPQDKVIVGVPTRAKPKWRLRSSRHPFFNKFRERMYGTGKKVVDPHYLTLLDWEFLAIWYQQDGYLSAYLSKGKYPQPRVALCTNGFSYADNMLLRSKLKEYLDLDWNVTPVRTKSGNLTYSLIIAPKDIDKMFEGISKFVQPSFEYKIDKQKALSKVSLTNGPSKN